MYSIHYFLREYRDERKDDPESSGFSLFPRPIILKQITDLFHRVHHERTVVDDRLANRFSEN
jgi:hypothetical protein